MINQIYLINILKYYSGYIAQFTPLSLFCFLFCMALDIFIKFRKMDPHTDTGLEKKKVGD